LGYTLSTLSGGITNQISSSMMNYVAGVALNGVLIMSSSSGFHDPYFPKTWTHNAPTADNPDSCMGRTTTTSGSIVAGSYHYKMLTPCILESINVVQGQLCSVTDGCKSDK
jgi:hypothetical protein